MHLSQDSARWLKISYHIIDNQLSPISAATIWDAAKATIRCYIISQLSLIMKLSVEKREKFEAVVNNFFINNSQPR